MEACLQMNPKLTCLVHHGTWGKKSLLLVYYNMIENTILLPQPPTLSYLCLYPTTIILGWWLVLLKLLVYVLYARRECHSDSISP